MRTKTPFLPERMLDAAGRLFGTQRFHEVRMEDIAIEAGVSKGTVYRYFRDKEEMYVALLARASHQMIGELKSRLADAADARAALVAVVDAIVHFFDEQPHIFDLIQRAEVRQIEGDPFPWQMARDQGTKLLLEVFERGRQEGMFTIRSPKQAVLMFFGGLRSVVRYGEKPRPRQLARRIVEDFLNGARYKEAAGRVKLTGAARR